MTFEAASEFLYIKKIEELQAEVERLGEEIDLLAKERNDANDTVDKLQAEVERLRGNGIHTCHEQCQRVACVLRRQRDKLAEGLRMIALTVDGFEDNELARQTLKDAGCADE